MAVAELVPLIVATLAVALLVPYYLHARKWNQFPLINKHKGEFFLTNARQRYRAGARDLLLEGIKTVDGPFRLATESGMRIFLPPSYVDWIKNEPRMSFPHASRQEMSGWLSGFEIFGQGVKTRVGVEVVQKKITNNIGVLTDLLSAEMTSALQDVWTDNQTYHQIDLRRSILTMVARLSSAVFVGPELSKNEDWLRVSVDYTVDSFNAIRELRNYPWYTRWLVQWYLPSCHKVRVLMKEAHTILEPIIAERRKERAANGGKTNHFDAIEWGHEVANGRYYNPIYGQVGLALAAIHTTTDLLSKTVHQLAAHPEVLPQVRAEVAEVLQTYGWNKTGMYQMKMLDSIIKETQRMDSVSLATMGRKVMEDVTLPNGVVLPKGALTSVVSIGMREKAPEFDPMRFYNVRQEGGESRGQLVSVTSDHLSFGYGKHACPGRFFAAHEIKIALSHILMKYDIRYVGSDMAKTKDVGLEIQADTSARLEVRRRREEAVM